jgi:hypothetical protein
MNISDLLNPEKPSGQSSTGGDPGGGGGPGGSGSEAAVSHETTTNSKDHDNSEGSSQGQSHGNKALSPNEVADGLEEKLRNIRAHRESIGARNKSVTLAEAGINIKKSNWLRTWKTGHPYQEIIQKVKPGARGSDAITKDMLDRIRNLKS